MKDEVIGLIPACGAARRISPVPCSKEIFPVGIQYADAFFRSIPKVISEYLLTYYRVGGIKRVYFIIRKDKKDIPAYFGQRNDIPLELNFLEMESSPSASHSIDFAYPWFKDHPVALGFPDMLISPADSFKRIVDELKKGVHDIVLGLYPIEEKHKWDMVEFDGEQITDIVIKPPQTDLRYGWSIAAWRPSFSLFFHRYLQQKGTTQEEMHPGRIIRAAIAEGFKTGYVLFESGRCLDTGTPEDLQLFFKPIAGF